MRTSDDIADDHRDGRLDTALDLLHQSGHTPRDGLLSLTALVGLLVSGTLLVTLISGRQDKPEDVPIRAAVAPITPVSSTAGFELSGSPVISENSSAQPVQDAVLIGTER